MRAVHVFISYSERLSELTMKMQLFQRFIFCFNTGQCQVPNIPDAELVGGRELAYVNHETVIEFRCMAGLVPRDSANIKCDNGTWSSKPECIPGKWVWFFAKKANLGCVKRICVFEHSVMTNFSCACPAIQRGQGSGFLSEGSSWFTASMIEQRRFWRDCAHAQARLNLRCLHRR